MPDTPDMTPLQMATTPELIVELFRRHNTVLIAMTGSVPGDERVRGHWLYHNGDLFAAAGLAAFAAGKLQTILLKAPELKMEDQDGG